MIVYKFYIKKKYVCKYIIFFCFFEFITLYTIILKCYYYIIYSIAFFNAYLIRLLVLFFIIHTI